jgi:hypothetical protein
VKELCQEMVAADLYRLREEQRRTQSGYLSPEAVISSQSGCFVAWHQKRYGNSTSAELYR